jgi:adenylate cyclase
MVGCASAIKLIFDFCAEAHCFDDIYAKVLPAEEAGQGSSVHHLSITSMNQKDREVLAERISQAS